MAQKSSHARGRSRMRGMRKKPPVMLARMPGLNFDTFEPEPEHREAVFGTDRAPTYQSRAAAASPRRYVRKLLSWLSGSPAKPRRAKRGRVAKAPARCRRRRAAQPRHRRRARAKASRTLH